MTRTDRRLAACAIVFAALCATALGHTIVGLLTYARVIPGPYATYRHGSMEVVVALAAAIACAFALFSALGAVFARPDTTPAGQTAARLRSMMTPTFGRVACVLAVQLPALAAIETIEQVQQFGHPLAFSAFLGAPPLVAVIIHLSCALLACAGIGALLRVTVSTCVCLRHAVAPRLRRRPTSGAARPRTVSRPTVRAPQSPLALHVANRPPPVLARA